MLLLLTIAYPHPRESLLSQRWYALQWEDSMGEAAPQAAEGAWSTAARDEEAIAALKWSWGDAYEVGEGSEGGWWAVRRDGTGGRIAAADPGELHALVSADYSLSPVSRDFDSGER
jgi:hypothetical protein